jgi:hypothetical protein
VINSPSRYHFLKAEREIAGWQGSHGRRPIEKLKALPLLTSAKV